MTSKQLLEQLINTGRAYVFYYVGEPRFVEMTKNKYLVTLTDGSVIWENNKTCISFYILCDFLGVE